MSQPVGTTARSVEPRRPGYAGARGGASLVRVALACIALTSVALTSVALGDSSLQAASSSTDAVTEAPADAGTASGAVNAAPARPEALGAGTWALRVETSAGTGTPTVVLTQEGNTLSGTYRGRFGDQPVTGTLSGNNIKFTFLVSGPMGSAQVTYTGTVDGDTMSGTMQMGDRMGGRFTGKRTP